MAVEHLYTLRVLHATSGVPLATLRAEIRDGRLRAVRARDSCCAPLLVAESDWQRWLEEHASRRLAVPSPREVARGRAGTDVKATS